MRIDVCLIIIFFFFTSVNPAYSQKDSLGNNKDKDNAITTINMFREPTYITLLGGVGNIEPLIFEADIIPYFMLSLNKNTRWGIELSPRVILRMYNKYSYPVRTPSYMPRATFYYQIIDNHECKNDWFAFCSWSHHSNGQDGNFYNNDNKTINTLSGNFTTNMVEAGAFISRPYKRKPNIVNYLKFSLTYHYKQNHELENLYGRWRIFLDYKSSVSISKILKVIANTPFKNKKANLNQLVRIGWIAGKMYSNKDFDIKRLVFQYTFSYKPSFCNDVTLFAQYYHGQDYYNIYFNRNLNLLRFGIAAKTSIFN